MKNEGGNVVIYILAYAVEQIPSNAHAHFVVHWYLVMCC